MKINQSRFQEEIVDTTVILNDTQSMNLHILEGTAFEIWALLRHRTDIDEKELAQHLSKKYHVSLKTCQDDVKEFIQGLKEVGYLE